MKTKTTLAAIVTALAVLVGLSAASTAATTPPVIYLVPHQDDETLSMGADIRAHLAAGKDVHLYLYTDGHETGVCSSSYIPLNDADCTKARDGEFDVATNLLGVDAANVHRVKDPATGQRPGDHPTQAAARRMLDWIIADVDARYPGQASSAGWKAMSWGDEHSGHAVMGVALREKYLAGAVNDVRFFLKRDDNNVWSSRPSGTTRTIGQGTGYKTESYWRVRAASYSYGIGNLSVPARFDDLRADPRSLVHDATR